MWNYISPLLSLLLIAAAATGQCDFEKVGSWSPPESTTIATDNEHLYLNRGGDLIIADRAITDHLFVLGELELPGTIQRIFPEGDQLWILSGDDGLFLVDISDPSIPNLITALDTSGWAQEIVLRDQYAYIADGNGGLLVVDMWNPLRPVEVSRLSFSGGVVGVTLHGDFAYVALGEIGIGVVDISQPRNAKITNEYETHHSVAQVAIANGSLYAVMPDFGLEVFSLNDPSGVMEVTSSLRWDAFSPEDRWAPPSTARAQFDEKYAYFISEAQLTLVDISDPTRIIPVGWHSEGKGREIGVEGTSIYTLSRTVRIFERDDFELTKPPPFIASISTPTQPRDIAFQGNYAYVTTRESLLWILDNGDINRPRSQRAISTPHILNDIEIAGSYSYHTSGTSDPRSEAIKVFDLSDASNPMDLGPEGSDFVGDAFKLIVSGDRAILAVDWYSENDTRPTITEILIFDVSDPSSPQLVSDPIVFETPGIDVAIQGDVLMVAQGVNSEIAGFSAFDISNPHHIREIGPYFPEIVDPKRLTTMDELLLIGTDTTLYIADFSNPFHPSLLTSVELPLNTHLTFLGTHDRTAYWVSFRGSVNTIRLDDPRFPSDPVQQSTGFDVKSIVSGDSGAYFVGQNSGIFLLNPDYQSENYTPLRWPISIHLPWSRTNDASELRISGSTAVIYSLQDYWLADLSNPPDFRFTGPYPLPGRSSHWEEFLAFYEPYIYSYDERGSRNYLQVTDVSDIDNPVDAGQFATGLIPGEASITISNGKLILHYLRIVEIYDLQDPSHPQLERTHTLPDYIHYLGNVVYHQNRLFYTTGSGIHLVDLSDPSGQRDTTIESPFLNGRIHVVHPFVYISGINALQVIDITDPSAPVWVRGVDTDYHPHIIETVATNGLLFQTLKPRLSAEQPPTRVFSLEDPSTPSLLETDNFRLTHISDLDQQGNEILTLDNSHSLNLLQIKCGSCRSDENTLCLGEESRFETSLKWWGSQRGQGGVAAANQQSAESGLLFWVDPENPEMIVKVLDATEVNDAHWLFAAGATDVGYALSVEDKITGEKKEYLNELGTPACAVTDTAAFPIEASEGASATPARSSLTSSASTELLLHDFRFRLTLEWRSETGPAEAAFAIPHSDKSGFFYWTNPDNLEMVVKVLNGREINGHFWVFAATSSNVEFRLKVVDTEKGLVREYFNPLGEAACAVRDTGFF